MIFIVTDLTDISATNVIRWLKSFGKSVIRLNVKNQTSHFLSSSDLSRLSRELKKVKSIWYRRSPGFIDVWDSKEQDEITNAVNSNVRNEFQAFFDYYNFEFTKLKPFQIGNPYNGELNKLIQLQVANDVGLLTPKTFLVTTSKEIKRLHAKYKKIIIKPSSFQHFLSVESSNATIFGNLTTLLTKKDISLMQKVFPLTTCQVYVEKQFEVRSFYLQGKLYSTAIFSQDNPKTVTDYRNYDFVTPNRYVPFRLPKDIESKLRKFMKRIKRDSGSFDLICTPDNCFYFLEINLEGQFDGVSVDCNYYLGKEIARKLASYE